MLLLAAWFFITVATFVVLGPEAWLAAMLLSLPVGLAALALLSDTPGRRGALVGALLAVAPSTATLTYHAVAGWPGGADIGMGILMLFLPVYGGALVAGGYLVGALIENRSTPLASRLRVAAPTLALLIGVAATASFALAAWQDFELYRMDRIHDPSAAEVYWLGMCWNGAIALVTSVATSVCFRMLERSASKMHAPQRP